MARYVAWFWLVTSAIFVLITPGCSGNFWGDGSDIRPYNTPPTIQITGPADGAAVEQGNAVTFEAVAGDTEDFATDLRVEWSSSIDGTLFSTVDAPQAGCPDLAGQCVFYSDALSVGIHLITVRVWDTGNFSASSQISLEILEKQEAPTCEITAPEQDSLYSEGDSVAFTAVAKDANGDLMTLLGTWASDINGVLETRSPDPSGNLGYTTAGDGTPESAGATALSVGRHTITLSLEDPSGLTGFCTRFVTIEAQNRAPTVSIGAPADGSEYVEGDGIRFAGQATDDRDDPTELSITWESSIQGVLSQAPADDAGNVSFVTSDLRAGVHTIFLKALDSGGKVSEKTMLLTLIAQNEAPTADIVSLSPEGEILEGTSITLTGLVSDPNDSPLNLSVSWTSSLQGELPGGSEPDSDGNVFLNTAGLVVGTHAVTLRVEDPAGLKSTATLPVAVRGENEAPTVQIITPESGTFALGESLLFSGIVADSEDVASTLTVEWLSDLDGLMPFVDSPDDGGNVNFLFASLSEGTHLITLKVTDSEGAIGADAIVLTIRPANRPPTIELTGPSVRAFDVGQTIVFTALVADPEDAPQTLEVAFVSDRAGAFCEGVAPDNAGNVLCSVSTFEAGTHVVVVSVTDPAGLLANDTMTINVQAENQAPSAEIEAPLDDILVTEGTAIAFRGVALDFEDQEEELLITWTSSIDGVFNSAPADNAGNLIFAASDLSVGTHEVTLKVEDSAGYFATDSVVFQVREENTAPTAEILTPEDDDLIFLEGETVLFEGQVGDAQDDVTALAIIWVSDRSEPGDDVLNDTPADSTGAVQFTSATLSAGTHLISLRVTDSEGRVAVASRRVVIRAPNAPPVVEILQPGDGQLVTEFDVLTFEGKVSDSETITTDLIVSWASNIDGEINANAPDAGGNLGFTFSTLTVGTHLITLTAEDNDGDTSSDAVTVVVRSENAAPTAEIVTPVDGLATLLGEQIIFQGQVGDIDQSLGGLSITWTSDIDGELNSAPADSSGLATFATTALSPGSHLVTFRVEDDEGAVAVDTVSLSVTAQNRPPTVEIIAPEAGAFVIGDPITFEAQISDPEDDPRSLGVSWESSLLGGAFNSDLSDASGRISFVYDGLGLGTHLIELFVTDTGGLTSADSVLVTIRTENELPVVQIVAPSEGHSVFQGASVAFEGLVSDAEDAETALSISWASDLDGALSTAPANSSGVTQFSTAGLSAGVHTINLTAQDQDGGIGVASVAITVRTGNTVPEATITAPESGLVLFEGATVTFQGEASDVEDAETDLGISWSSNLDGVLGTDGADGAGNVVLATSALSVGTHVITLEVTDLDLSLGTDTVTVTIRSTNNLPTAEIQSPANASVFTEGENVDFLGALADVEDAEASLAVLWRSSIDGDLNSDSPDASGVSGFSVADLSVGIHVISLRVTDLDGGVGTDSVEISVEGPNQPPTIDLIEPVDGLVHTTGSPITFRALVDDSEDAPTVLAISATSDLLGEFATSTADGAGNVAFSTSALTVGTHFVTVRVEDLDGGVASASVSIRVRDPNAQPVAEITSPSDGDITFDGSSVVLIGVVSDSEDAASSLTAQWTSSRDGVLGSSSPDGSGNVSLTVDSLSVGTHTITLLAGDTETGSGSDLISLIVRSPNVSPTTEINAPLGSEVIFDGDVVLFDGTVSDPEDLEAALIIEWKSSLDGILNTDPADSGGTTSFALSALSVGNHTITLKATDLDAGFTNDTVAITIRPANELPDVTITGPAVTDYIEGESVALAATVSDVEDAANQLEYRISSDRDGILVASGTPGSDGSISYVAAGLSVGTHVITIRVVDLDGGIGTDTIQVTISAPNTAPSTSLTAPSTGLTVNTTDIVLFKGIASDAQDTAGTLTYSLASSIDGVIGAGNPTSAGNISVSTGLSAGEHVITLTVTDTGALSDSDSINITVVVPNEPPVIVLTGPSSTDFEEGADVDFSAEVSDVEDAFADLSVSWVSDVDAELFVGAPNASGISAFTAASLSVGTHIITATVTDLDGASASRTMTINIIPENIPPEVEITQPTSGQVSELGDSLLFVGTATDAETDNTLLLISWTSSLDGALDTSAPDSAGNIGFSIASLTEGTHTITLRAEDLAGDFSTTAINLEVREANEPPTEPTAVLSPALPKTGDTLSVVPSGSTDPNGDVVSYTYQWFKNGAAQAGQTTDTLLSVHTSKDDIWKVRVTPTDGADDGPFVEEAVSILNTAPSIASVQISPTTAYEGTELTATVNGYSDPDGDASASTIEWYVNGGTKVATGIFAIDGDLFNKDDVITARVTASDGEDTGATVISNSVTILNTVPTVPGVELTPVDPNQGDNLVCEVTTPSTDVDLEPVTYLYEWFKDGSLQSGETVSDTSTANTLASSKTKLGESWRCEVTPSDADGDGTSDSDSVDVLPDAGDLVITELMINPSAVSDSLGEFVEIYNTTTLPIFLDGFELSDGVADNHTITTGGSLFIPAASYIVLAKDERSGVNGGVAVDYQYSAFTLSDGGDVVTLKFDGRVVDTFTYGSSAVPNGRSLSLDPASRNATANDSIANWCPAMTDRLIDGDVASPGFENESCACYDSDGDSDTYGDAAACDVVDCDDSNADIHPSAMDECDVLDQNCDGSIQACDCDSTDLDGDGYGTGSACVDVDCDDTDPLIFPNQTETCDGSDQDCDDAVDEGFDVDGDGYYTCDGGGAAGLAEDCDDDPSAGGDTAYPGAPTLCDAYDNDCDSDIDEGFDGDGDGNFSCVIGSVNADCNDANSAMYYGNTEFCDAYDNDCDGDVNEGEEDRYESNNEGGQAYDTGTLEAGNTISDGNIHNDSDTSDFYQFYSKDDGRFGLYGEFFVSASLSNIPAGNDYDLFLYKEESNGSLTLLRTSSSLGTNNEDVRFDGDSGDDDSGTYLVEVRRISGFSCSPNYSLNLQAGG